jgi:hypothetical protein
MDDESGVMFDSLDVFLSVDFVVESIVGLILFLFDEVPMIALLWLLLLLQELPIDDSVVIAIVFVFVRSSILSDRFRFVRWSLPKRYTRGTVIAMYQNVLGDMMVCASYNSILGSYSWK